MTTPTPTPHTNLNVTGLTSDQVAQLDTGIREWEDHGGAILDHLAPVVAALTAAAAIVTDRTELLPAESMALTVGLAQTLRGEAPDGNVAAFCVLALARLTGRHDWTAEAEQIEPVWPPDDELPPLILEGDVAAEGGQA